MRMTHQKNVVKLLREASGRHNLYDVFSHFVELSAITLASIDLAQKERREVQYLQTIGRYTKEEAALFPKMFAELVLALEAEPGDVLGEVFGQLELGNAARGQFFTPYEIAKLMAETTVDRGYIDEAIAERGYLSVSEPACGAGAMLIAFVEKVKELGYNPAQMLHFTAVDVDARAVHMAYLQLGLLGVPGVVVEGNTLTLEEREHWYTPIHIIHAWGPKVRRGYALDSAMGRRMYDVTGDEAPVAPALLLEQAMSTAGPAPASVVKTAGLDERARSEPTPTTGPQQSLF